MGHLTVGGDSSCDPHNPHNARSKASAGRRTWGYVTSGVVVFIAVVVAALCGAEVLEKRLAQKQRRSNHKAE